MEGRRAPAGIILLAIIFIIISVVGFILALGTATLSGRIFYDTVMDFLLISSVLNNPYISPGLAIILLYPSMGTTTLGTVGIGLLPLLFVGSLIFAVLYFIASVGLLYMKNWGYYLALIIGIINIIGGVLILVVAIDLTGLIILVFGIVIVVYLMRKAKFYFETEVKSRIKYDWYKSS